MKSSIEYQCPICGAKYKEEKTGGCFMCGWKHDEQQEKFKDENNGLNQICFNKYKRVYYFEIDNIFSNEDFLNIDKTLVRLYFQNPEKYDLISDDELEKKIKDRKKKFAKKEFSPICKVCGLGKIEYEFAICDYCGWEADGLQNDEPDYIGGANDMSLNQYKQFWEDSKEDLLKHKKDLPFYAFEKAREYYQKHFEEQNMAYFRKVNPNYDEDQKRFEENRINRMKSPRANGPRQ